MSYLIQYQSLSDSKRHRRQIKIRKEEVKSFLFVDGMTLDLKDLM